MIAALKRSVERFLGRGEAAITVPPMDGPLKPNRLLEEAEVVATFDAPEDLVSDGESLWVADGPRLLRGTPSGTWSKQRTFARPITAIAYVGNAGVLAIIGGDEIAAATSQTWIEGRRQVRGRPLYGITAISGCRDGSILATEGSRAHGATEWVRDLMLLGCSGRVLRLTPDGKGDTELATGLRYAFGALECNGTVWASETWAHRIVAIDRTQRKVAVAAVLDRLPAYPSRLAHAADGGVWLTMFAARTRLVEFVLREPEYRKRMLAEVDPRHWVAPAVSSGRSFLEPLQGGGVKQLGILKPWAPPRSYGLVIRLNNRGQPVYSLHSRADGQHHGVTAVAEARDSLYILSKGSGRLLRLRLEQLEILRTESA